MKESTFSSSICIHIYFKFIKVITTTVYQFKTNIRLCQKWYNAKLHVLNSCKFTFKFLLAIYLMSILKILKVKGRYTFRNKQLTNDRIV